MEPDKKYLEKVSTQTGFQKDNLEKVWRLTVLLKKIFETASVKEVFLLRGGTALNFMYFDISRLSVDIDLDFVGAVGKDDMQAQREPLTVEFRRIVEGLKYNSIEPVAAYASSQFILKYRNCWSGHSETKIDLNWMMRLPVRGKTKAYFKSMFPEVISAFEINTLSAKELFASKIITFLARNEPRDLYDVYEIALKMDNCDMNLLRKLLIWTGCTEEEDFRRLSKFGGITIDEEEFKQIVHPLLRRKDRPEFYKLKNTVEVFVNKVLGFTHGEQDFISNFYKKQIDPERLFEKYPFPSNILQHPNLLWRLQNMK